MSGAHEGTTTYPATIGPPGPTGSPQISAVVSMDVNDLGELLVTGVLIGELRLGGIKLNALGGQAYDVFAAKLDPEGTPLLAARYGDEQRDLAVGGALDPAGNVLVTGFFEGQLVLGTDRLVSQGGEDIFVAKLIPEP
jgi:hypothetical protein